MILGSNTFEYKWNITSTDVDRKGTYAISGSNVTLEVTEIRGGYYYLYEAPVENSTFYTKEQLLTIINANLTGDNKTWATNNINSAFSTVTYTFATTSNTLSLTPQGGGNVQTWYRDGAIPWTIPSATALSANQFTDGSITTAPYATLNGAVWYSINVTSGTTYYLWREDRSQNTSDTTKAYTRVRAYYDNGTRVNTYDWTGAWNDPQYFTATSTGTVYIRVAPTSLGNSGAFSIAYNSTGIKPGTTWTAPSATALTRNVAKEGSITESTTNGEVWYSFDATNGTRYDVWWDDLYSGNSGKTLDVRVSAYYSNGAIIFTGIDWATASQPQSFVASSTGKIYVKVAPWSSGNTGTFNITYNYLAPTNPTALTSNVWKDGEITGATPDKELWYSFSVTSGTTYSISWNDLYWGDSTKTLYTRVSAYYSNGTEIFRDQEAGWNNPRSFVAESAGTVYVRVRPGNSENTGTFALKYYSVVKVTGTVNVTLNGTKAAGGQVYASAVSSGQQLGTAPVDAAGNFELFLAPNQGDVRIRLNQVFTGTFSASVSTVNDTTYNIAAQNKSVGSIGSYDFVSVSVNITDVTWNAATVLDSTTYNGVMSGYSVELGTAQYGTSNTYFQNRTLIVESSSTEARTYAVGMNFYPGVQPWIRKSNLGLITIPANDKTSKTITLGTVAFADWVEPAASASTLVSGQWTNGTLTDTVRERWYKFSVTNGNYYYWWLNDTNSSLAGAVDGVVSIYYSDGTAISSNINPGSNNNYVFNANSSGTVYVKVEAYGNTGNGNFQIGYNTTSSKPTNWPPASLTPLTSGTWKDGSITGSTPDGEVWYSFNVTNGTAYGITWEDRYSGTNTKTLVDARVSAYYSDGTAIFTGRNGGWSNPPSFVAASTGMVYVMVSPWNSGNTGTFAIKYYEAVKATGTINVTLNNAPPASVVLNSFSKGANSRQLGSIQVDITNGNFEFFFEQNQGPVEIHIGGVSDGTKSSFVGIGNDETYTIGSEDQNLGSIGSYDFVTVTVNITDITFNGTSVLDSTTYNGLKSGYDGSMNASPFGWSNEHIRNRQLIVESSSTEERNYPVNMQLYINESQSSVNKYNVGLITIPANDKTSKTVNLGTVAFTN